MQGSIEVRLRQQKLYGLNIKKNATFLFGRGNECQIRLDGPDISRKHGQVSFNGSGFFYENFSANGSLYNGAILKPGDSIVLTHNDVISISDVDIIFRSVPLEKEFYPGEKTVYSQLEKREMNSQVRLVEQCKGKEVLHPISKPYFSMEIATGPSIKASFSIRILNGSGFLDQAENIYLNCAKVSNLPLRLLNGDILDLGERRFIYSHLDEPFCKYGIVTKSECMKEIITKVELLANRDEPVLVLGETGTGKELVARALHLASLRAKTGKFVTMNCASLAPTLADSILFGHEKGSFTGADKTHTGLMEEANNGTLFLDEVGDLPMETQTKLLRAVQNQTIRPVGSVHEKKVSVRIVSATNRNLWGKENSFREDLYQRLAKFEVTLPPLRKRKEDIPLLIDHFASIIQCGGDRLKNLRMGESVYAEAKMHYWPGNVRELETSVLNTLVFNESPSIKHLYIKKIGDEPEDTVQKILNDELKGISGKYKSLIKLVAEHARQNKHVSNLDLARLLHVHRHTIENWWTVLNEQYNVTRESILNFVDPKDVPYSHSSANLPLF